MTLVCRILALMIGGLAVWPVAAVAQDHFLDRVAPILQSRCLSCHNDADSKGDFSLQSKESAFADGYIVGGNADDSHLLDLITPVDGQAEMPQDGAPISDEEIAAIRKWIKDGAKWPQGFVLTEPAVADFDWWSYQPVQRPALPDCSNDPWVNTPVDSFVLSRMREKGLRPSKPADRRTLIRRLTFDLHGLPPTPDEAEAFIHDTDPQAYEKLVDRLLASPRYGERWARHWLDVVQYADTCGYDKDKLRPNAWPYRDYVIRSFNEDKPWERFVREQIAGDVLFPGESDGIVGLGFIAAGPWDFIGHVEVPESKIDGKVARNLDRDNMVTNTINAFCSLTVQCARCHHHKHDPITQEHYYGLQAIFAAVDRAERPYDADVEVAATRKQLKKLLQRHRLSEFSLQREIEQAGGEKLQQINKQIEQLQAGLINRVVKKEPQFGYHSQITTSPETEKWVALEFPQPVDVLQIVLHPCHDEFAGIGAGFGFPNRFRVEVSTDGKGWQPALNQVESDLSNPGLNPVLIENISADKIKHIRVTATKLAERSGDFNFALAEIEVFDHENRNVAADANVTSLDSIEMPDRWSRDNLNDGRWPVWETESTELEVELNQLLQERRGIFAKLNTPERQKRRRINDQRLEQLRVKLAGLPKQQRVYAAATHFESEGSFQPTGGIPREVYVLNRGNVTQPGELASPGLLPLYAEDSWQVFDDLSEDMRRVSLARWLTDPKHRLVWRSIVNRVWQHHFGQGIVATPNDFGRMGVLPTHPELLDWLTVEFLENGQSMKYLHRIMVTSSVYQQSSEFDASNSQIDTGNQFLWRMHRRRLSAEEIRDSILCVSGALDLKMGGPGYYLFELEKTEHSPHYEYHKFDPADPATHRRSIYRFVVRSQPDPWMTTLDCADSSQSTPKRSETLSALQSLSLLNNKFNLEMAKRFAGRLRDESANTEQQVDRAMQLFAQRPASDEERIEMAQYATEHGLENLCRLLFNLSEFMYVD